MKINLPWSHQRTLKKTQHTDSDDAKKLFLESSKILKDRREEYGISKNDLAKKEPEKLKEMISSFVISRTFSEHYLPLMAKNIGIHFLTYRIKQ